MINPDASRGAAAALVASDDGLDLAMRSTLAPERVPALPGSSPLFPPLTRRFPARFRPTRSVTWGSATPATRLIAAGAGERREPGLAAAVATYERVRELGEVDLEKDLLPSLGGEGAFALD